MNVVSSDVVLHEVMRLEQEIQEAKQKLSDLRRQLPPEPIADHALAGPHGPVRLSDLFGDHADLLLIHNMGRGCMYCTLWADGFVGLYPHIHNRAAFVLVSPNEPDVQQAFAESRGWPFPVVSSAGTRFFADMGFESESGVMPGVSALHKDPDGRIFRTGKAVFGPGDDFCAVWPLFDLLDQGAGDWEPRLRYSELAIMA